MRFLLAGFYVLLLSTVGCGGFAARRIAQAPNTYPKWLAPEAPVTIAFNVKLLTLLTNGAVEIASPHAKIFYRVLAPGDYGFRWTNELDEARGELNLRFSAETRSAWEASSATAIKPRGTVFVLHGYGVEGAAMLPWGFVLAEQGWRVVLVDLRGHGNSTGERVHFGVQEVSDLKSVLDELEQGGGELREVHAVGHSFGAVLALKWKLEDARISKVVAMAPYGDLTAAIQNVRRQYARWIPRWFIAAGVRQLPELLEAERSELDPGCWVDGRLDDVLFVAGEADRIATLDQVRELVAGSGKANRMLLQSKAAHETLPFYLEELSGEVIQWLSAGTSKKVGAAEPWVGEVCGN